MFHLFKARSPRLPDPSFFTFICTQLFSIYYLIFPNSTSFSIFLKDYIKPSTSSMSFPKVPFCLLMLGMPQIYCSLQYISQLKAFRQLQKQSQCRLLHSLLHFQNFHSFFLFFSTKDSISLEHMILDYTTFYLTCHPSFLLSLIQTIKPWESGP